MTAINIKALAEETLKYRGPYLNLTAERTEREKLFATALLKVLEDGNDIKNALQRILDESDYHYTFEAAKEALESHEKLMEELSGEN